MAEPPLRIIRFYGNPQYALECLGLKQVTFLHVDKLNDPFDPNLAFETDFNDDYQALIDHVKQIHPKDFSTFQRHCPRNKWKGFIKDMKCLSDKHRKSLFLFSTSEVSKDEHPKYNLHMWGHYGDGHRGIAIEFDTGLLTMAILKEQEDLGGEEIDKNDLPSKIIYSDNLPMVTCEHIFQFVVQDTPVENEEAWMKTELADIIRQRASIKSMVWETEKEWRYMRRNDETKLMVQRVNLLDETITRVYLGLRYQLNNDQLNDAVIFETRKNFPKAEIYKAKTIKGKIALAFEQIAGPSKK